MLIINAKVNVKNNRRVHGFLLYACRKEETNILNWWFAAEWEMLGSANSANTKVQSKLQIKGNEF